MLKKAFQGPSRSSEWSVQILFSDGASIASWLLVPPFLTQGQVKLARAWRIASAVVWILEPAFSGGKKKTLGLSHLPISWVQYSLKTYFKWPTWPHWTQCWEKMQTISIEWLQDGSNTLPGVWGKIVPTWLHGKLSKEPWIRANFLKRRVEIWNNTQR